MSGEWSVVSEGVRDLRDVFHSRVRVRIWSVLALRYNGLKKKDA